MLDLVWKDVVAARWLLLAGLPIYALQLVGMATLPGVFLMMSLVVSGLLAFGSLALEEVQGTTALWASLPVRRADIVFARYLTVMLGAVLGLGLSLGVERVAASLRGGAAVAPSTGEAVAAHAVLLLLLLLAAAVLLPLCFRLGTGSGVMAFAAVTVGALLVLSLGGQALLWLLGLSNPLLDPALYRDGPDAAQARAAAEWLRRRGPLLLGIAFAVTAAMLAISAGLSRRFYERRDLG